VATLNRTVTTDGRGSFTVGCLADGAYLLEVSQPLFGSARQQVEVRAGDDDAPLVKVQLQRVIFGTPYAGVQSFDGFLVCSMGFFEYASEECGEGVGVPCEVPAVGCHRVG